MTDTKQLVADAVERSPGITSGDLTRLLARRVTEGGVRGWLTHLHQAGEITRTGPSRHYRYYPRGHQMTKETWVTEIMRVLPRGTQIVERRGHMDVVVPVVDGDDVTLTLNVRTNPNHIQKMLKNKGYTLRGNKAYAPKEKDETVTTMKTALEQAGVTASSEAPKAQPSENAKSAKRNAVRWLDEAFETDKGRYKNGFSDDYIAKETGLSVKAVSDLRDLLGYELKEPEEVSVWRKAANDLADRIDQFETDASGALAKLREEHGALVKLIEDTAKRNGW